MHCSFTQINMPSTDIKSTCNYSPMTTSNSKWLVTHHHHHHHPRISSQRKSWTKLQGRCVSRITLMPMLLWPMSLGQWRNTYKFGRRTRLANQKKNIYTSLNLGTTLLVMLEWRSMNINKTVSHLFLPSICSRSCCSSCALFNSARWLISSSRDLMRFSNSSRFSLNSSITASCLTSLEHTHTHSCTSSY